MIVPTLALVSSQDPFLGGGICALTAVAALLFLRFYRRTRDLLFLFFSVSFLLQAVTRVALWWFAPLSNAREQVRAEDLAPFYLLRLLSYGLIIFAIIYKNRSRLGGPAKSS